MADMKEFRRIINGSKAYEFNGTVLEITGYYTGKRVRLDLSLITKEMLEELQPEEDEEEEEDEEYDD